MDRTPHMTKTEAHPYHYGRGVKVLDPKCPICRDEIAAHEDLETTYVSWSLYQTALDRIRDLRIELEEAKRPIGTDAKNDRRAGLETFVLEASFDMVQKTRPRPLTAQERQDVAAAVQRVVRPVFVDAFATALGMLRPATTGAEGDETPTRSTNT